MNEKFDANLSTKDIASEIRKDIKSAVKSKQIPKGKYSVRIQTYSGGASINVNIKSFPVQMLNAWRIKLKKEYDYIYAGNLPDEHPAHEAYTPITTKTLATLKSIVDAYNYDRSDTMTDYFDVNFYSHVGIDWQTESREEDEILKKIDSLTWPDSWVDFI